MFNSLFHIYLLQNEIKMNRNSAKKTFFVICFSFFFYDFIFMVCAIRFTHSLHSRQRWLTLNGCTMAYEPICKLKTQQYTESVQETARERERNQIWKKSYSSSTLAQEKENDRKQWKTHEANEEEGKNCSMGTWKWCISICLADRLAWSWLLRTHTNQQTTNQFILFWI